MYASSILSLLSMASLAFGCVQRSSACSPEDVCNSISGIDVCGTREQASGACQTSLQVPLATNPALSGGGFVVVRNSPAAPI
ncbi:hypothetical protein LX36DRAFT_714372 [Colletotrichum falcatum]|nr:hypothetical protein LX36DRAFT_714372 [Colletotrichum falcatum]